MPRDREGRDEEEAGLGRREEAPLPPHPSSYKKWPTLIRTTVAVVVVVVVVVVAPK